jgi:glycosyltransferase involved in cell wall biosynthesis
MSLKILHVSEPFASGTLEFMQELCFNLSKHNHVVLHVNRIYEQNIYAAQRGFHQRATFIAWEAVQREIHWFDDLKAAWQLIKVVRKEKPDIIHAHASKAGFLCRVFSRFFACPVVYTPHAISFLRLDISERTKKFYIFLEKFAHALHKNPNFVACSGSEERSIKKHIPKAKVFKINNGVKVRFVQGEQKEFPEVFTAEHPLVIVNAGVNNTQKNQERFFDIALSLHDELRVHFVWIGDTLPSSLVRCTGWLKHSSVIKNMRKSHVFLSTSLWEGLPLSALEAMSVGLPLLLSNCSGHVDLVSRQLPNGKIWNSNSEVQKHIEDILENPAILKTWSNNSLFLQKKYFNISYCAKNYDSFYKQLLEKRH